MQLYQSQIVITGDGTYHVGPYTAFSSITARWISEDTPPGGVLTFTVDHDPFGGQNSLDLGAGERVVMSTMKLAFIDIDVAGFPDGGIVQLYFR
jgi:hypothetical protein